MADPTLINAQNPTRAGVAPTWVTPTATWGDAIAWTPGTTLVLRNTNAGADAGTFTMTTNAATTGDAVTDKVYTLAAAAFLIVSDFDYAVDVQQSGVDVGRIIMIPGGAAVADLRYCVIAN